MSTRLLTPIGSILFAAALLWAGLQSTPSEAYFFPNLLAGALLSIGILMLISELVQKASARQGVVADTLATLGKLIPAFVIFVLYMMFARTLGFFAASFLAFIAIAIIYSPAERLAKVVGFSLGSATIFLAVLYAIFVLLLKVQLPAGMLF